MSGSPLTDEEFARIYKRNFERLVSVGQRTLGCRDLAEDAAQEALMDLWCSKERPRTALSTWLRQAVFFRSGDIRRRSRRSVNPERFLAGRPLEVEEDPLGGIVLEEAELTVREALKALPFNQQVVATMYAFDDLDYESISGALDVPVSTVGTWLRRARLGLAKALEKIR